MRTLLMICGVCASLIGQTATVMISRPEKEPETVAQVVQRVRKSRRAQWVLLEGAKPGWSATFRTLVQMDDDLSLANLPIQSFDFRAPVAEGWRAQQGWGPEARWILLSREGEMLSTRTDPPSAAALQEALAALGILGEAGELEAFLGRHADHIQARGALLSCYVRFANERTGAKLGLPKEAPPDAAAARPAEDLMEPDDERYWRKAADLLKRVLLSGEWRQGPVESWMSPRDSRMRHSRLMREVARQYIPLVEESLLQHPGNYSAWRVWALLAEASGGRPLRPLLEAITPMPGRREWLPDDVLEAYIRDARNRGDWIGLLEVLAPRWEDRKEMQIRVVSLGDVPGKTDALKPQWDGFLSPLVEAHLRLGHVVEADQLVREALSWMPSRGLPAWASTLALTCGQPALASQWAALPVPKG